MLEIDNAKTIPAAVRREELLAALQPLCDLLNVTPRHFYSQPGLTIGKDEITMLVPVPESTEDWVSDRPKSRKAANVGGLTAWSAELAQFVVVEVTD